MNNFLDGEIVLFINEGESQDLKVGQPSFFIETESEATVFQEATHFLNEAFVVSGSAPSRHTWAAAAQSLKTWFQYLQVIEKDWRDASRQDRLNYRDAYLTAVSPRTGENYSRSTIANRLSVIRSFYVHARMMAWYQGDIGWIGEIVEETDGRPIDQDALVHTRSASRIRQRDRDLPKSRPNVVFHPLQVMALRALLNHVGPQASNPGTDLRSPRDRLIVDLGWVVGLRVQEVINLNIFQFLDMTPDPDAPYRDMQMTILRKGNKKSPVAIPTWLVMDALSYIEGERAQALRQAKIIGRARSSQMFLSHPGSTRQGRPITVKRVQGLMQEICLALGLVESVEVRNPDTGEVIVRKRAKHSFHDLRHTCAVLMYHAERANGNPEPWKKIQAQLGHRHLQTTVDTYLTHVEIFTEQLGLLNVRRMIGL